MGVPVLLEIVVDDSNLFLRYSEPIKGVLPSRNRFQVKVDGVRNYVSADATLVHQFSFGSETPSFRTALQALPPFCKV